MTCLSNKDNFTIISHNVELNILPHLIFILLLEGYISHTPLLFSIIGSRHHKELEDKTNMKTKTFEKLNFS